nr:signal peptidase I [uncultured Sellimonas sp.]
MLKKICGFLSGVILLVLAVLAGILIIPKLMGYEEMAVLTGSMEPKYPVGSLIYVKEENPENLKVGDVITYRLSEDTVVTHRIVEINTCLLIRSG